jgi:putative DNA primase/helicase
MELWLQHQPFLTQSGIFEISWIRLSNRAGIMEHLCMSDPETSPSSSFVPSEWLHLVVPVDSFLEAEIPAKEWIVEDFLYSQSLAMIYAKRGVGKTRFVASLAVSIAAGTDFLIWRISKARRVLFVDGELSAPDLQGIFRDFAARSPIPNLELISSEMFSTKLGRGLNIATVEHQKEFFELLQTLKREKREPEIIIFDNHSSLTGGLDENDNSKQEIVLSFFRKLRHLGYTIILIHHAGKSGDQRGASTREDFLDLSIKLEAKESLDGSAKFDLSITKSRWKIAQKKYACELVRGASQTSCLKWVIRKKENASQITNQEVVLQWIYDNEPKTQAEIVNKIGRSRSTISRIVNALEEACFLQPDLTLTDKGKEFLNGD